MKVLITGMAGFIGFHTARRLAGQGVEEGGIDNLNDYYQPELKQARLASLNKSIRFVRMDISDSDRLIEFVGSERPDVVLHLAAQAGVRHSVDHPFAYAQSNLLGHLAILEACRYWEGLSHLIYASSSSVYGGNAKAPFSEDDRVDLPVSLYAATKRSDELMSSAYAHLYGIRQIGLRFFTVYGTWGRPDMAYWVFTRSILEGRPIHLYNHGQSMRDFTHVNDIVSGIIATVHAPVFVEGERPHRLYNIGNNQPLKVMDFLGLIETHAGKRAKVIDEPMPLGDVPVTFADIDHMKADYGFSPTVNLSDGVREFVDWYRSYSARA